MPKIKVKNPVVEMDGDEMTRIIWKFIKDKLILPYLEVDLKYFDLGIEHRDATHDQGDRRLRERHRSSTAWPSRCRHDHARRGARRGIQAPRRCGSRRTGTIRNIIGTAPIFREPIICKNVPRLVHGWTKPIVIGRHAFGDQYKATDFVVPGPGTLTMTYTPKDGGKPIEHKVFDKFAGRRRRARHVQRLDESIHRGFARSSMQLRPVARLAGLPLDEEHDPQSATTAASRICSRSVFDEGVQADLSSRRRASSTSTA